MWNLRPSSATMLPVIERSLSSRIWRGFLFAVVVAVFAGHVLGGWFLSGDIRDEYFTASAEPAASPDDWVYDSPAEAGLDFRLPRVEVRLA